MGIDQKNKVVNVDIDNVLNDFTDTVLRLYNQDHGTSFSVSNITTYDIAHSIGIHPEEFVTNYIDHPRTAKYCKPLSGSQEGLRYLNDRYTVNVVTARSWEQLLDIEDFFGNYFPYIKSSQIIRCVDKYKVPADILIDDCLSNIMSWPCGRILLDYPWNRGINDSEHLIFRVPDWKGIINIVNLMLKS